MQTRELGRSGLTVSALGLGCMAMSEFYGPADDASSKKVIRLALESGVTMLDTADSYGAGHNECLIAEVLRDWPGEACVATKFGIVRKNGEYRRIIRGRPDYVRESAEGSLKRLGREVIDLYYIHRVDGNVPIEDTVGAMADLVRAGKIRHIGLSEPSAETLRRAHAVHPVTAVQSEYSLWTREVEELFPILRELGIGFVPYSPLGRGALTGALNAESLRRSGDMRAALPRFSDDNLTANMARTQILFDLATAKGRTPAQIALAWILAQGEDLVPIPGTRRKKYLRENLASAELVLTTEDLARLDQAFPPGAIQGARYSPEGMVGLNG